jgi:hypothetical protein
MSPDQVSLLVGALRFLAWVIGVCSSLVFLTISGSVALVFKAWGKRIDGAEVSVGEAQHDVVELTKQVRDAATHCATMRADCARHLSATFATMNGLSDVDSNHKTVLEKVEREHRALVEKSVNAMQADVLLSREMVGGLVADLKQDLAKFQDTFWEAFHHHSHTPEGKVVRED